jgi:hypothetical protein
MDLAAAHCQPEAAVPLPEPRCTAAPADVQRLDGVVEAADPAEPARS